jgi:hypothetical protein
MLVCTLSIKHRFTFLQQHADKPISRRARRPPGAEDLCDHRRKPCLRVRAAPRPGAPARLATGFRELPPSHLGVPRNAESYRP